MISHPNPGFNSFILSFRTSTWHVHRLGHVKHSHILFSDPIHPSGECFTCLLSSQRGSTEPLPQVTCLSPHWHPSIRLFISFFLSNYISGFSQTGDRTYSLVSEFKRNYFSISQLSLSFLLYLYN